MKIVKKILLLGAIYYLVMVVQSCFVCKCPKAQFRSYSCTTLQSTNLSFNIETDSTFSYSIADATTDTFAALGYGCSIDFTIVKYASQFKRQQAFSLINQAYACSCNEYYVTSRDSINSLKIETVYDFDNNHSSGSDVTGLFVLLTYSYNPLSIIKENVSLQNINLQNNPIDESAALVSFIPYLNAAPTSPRKVQFKITAGFTSGKQFSTNTKEVFIN